VTDLLGNLLADTDAFLYVVVALGVEAVNMDHWQLKVGGEKFPVLLGIQADKGRQELDGARRQVHDVVGESLGLVDGLQDLGWRFGCLGLGSCLLCEDFDFMLSLKKLVGGVLDEDMAVLAEWFHVLINFVAANSVEHASMTVWVEIVGPDKDTFLAGRHCKRSDTSHDIANGLALGEGVDKPLVFSIQSAVPVDLCVVELESAVGFADLDVHVIGSSKDLVLEGAILALLADIIDLVDDGPDGRVFVNQDFADDVLVRHVLFTKVEMCNVTNECEAGWDLVVLLGLRKYSTGNFV
jgi:hypothetical protein